MTAPSIQAPTINEHRAVRAIAQEEEGGRLRCHHTQLRLHPHNMRRHYPEHEVAMMAQSIKATGGVLQPLLVVRDEQPDRYLVVDGNMRLAAARTLGDECPPLKCELISADRAQQLLIMVATSKFVFAKDPISEGLHYRRLMQEEGYSAAQIAEHTGVSGHTVAGRLRLLDLDEPIQEMVAAGRLPRDRRAADALLSIPDGEARVKMARRLAQTGANLKGIEAACERLRTALEEADRQKHEATPALSLARNGHALPFPSQNAPKGQLRAAAAAMCGSCELKASLPDVPEPAWLLVTNAAATTCERCSVRGDLSICKQCPAVELLRHLITAAGSK
jgi:ParB/RepB/Spo0J family partition protein